MAIRVHQLAKDLDLTPSEVQLKLREIGCHVRSASSTVEAEEVRRLRQHLAGLPVVPPARRQRPNPFARPRPETLEQEVERLKRESRRGKRYRGEVDAATQHFLERAHAHVPPYLDEYDDARRRTDEWLVHGFISPEQIVRWEVECSGIAPTVGIAFLKAGLSTRHAKVRWDGHRLNPEGDLMLYQSMGTFTILGREIAPALTFDNAIWLLRRAGLAS